MKIVFVGAGRLATNLARALHEAGHSIEAVYSRTMASAEALCLLVGDCKSPSTCMPTDDIDALPRDADVYILAVKDDALPHLIDQLHRHCPDRLLLHTAGSVPMSVFGSHAQCGVFYPMQTFSKERQVDFSRVHIFIEGSTPQALQTTRELAESINGGGPQVTELTSDQRRLLHLSAVFACNFANHCYALAEKILAKEGIPFDVLLPLIDETTAKVHTMSPQQAQTGPAIRYDQSIISRQSQLLADDPLLQQVYDLMSQSIHQLAIAEEEAIKS